MAAVRYKDTPKESIADGRERYLCHTNDLMMVVIDLNDGPADEPDAPHHHPHEQITYVAEGTLLFFLDDTPYELSAGDMMTVSSNVPHSIQLLSKKARLVDTFSPPREDFLI